MLYINKKAIAFLAALLLQGCNILDEYLLGEDNAPKPASLQPIKSRVNLVEKWSVRLPNGGKASEAKSAVFLKLKPEVVGNIIYTADLSGHVAAFDKMTGKVRWSLKLSRGIISGPTIGYGFIALGMDDSSLILLNQLNGKVLWEKKLSGDLLSAPLISDNKVIVKTIDGNLSAFDLHTHKRVWTLEFGSPNFHLTGSSSPIAVNNELALVGFADGKLNAINLKDGSEVWQQSLAYPRGASDVERLVDIETDPIVSKDVVYFASYQGYVGALSLKDGEFIWRREASVYKNMAIDDKSLYFTDGDDVVWAINRQNGQVVWKQTSLKARGLTPPVILSNHLILGDRTGLLHVIETQTGVLLSRKQLASAVFAAPITASSNTLYVMASNGNLSRIEVS